MKSLLKGSGSLEDVLSGILKPLVNAVCSVEYENISRSLLNALIPKTSSNKMHPSAQMSTLLVKVFLPSGFKRSSGAL